MKSTPSKGRAAMIQQQSSSNVSFRNSIPARSIHPCPSFIGLQIKYWRKQRSMTQKQLSDITGIKLRHLQSIESGRVDVKIRTLGYLSLGLKITIHKLLEPVSANRSAMCSTCRKTL